MSITGQRKRNLWKWRSLLYRKKDFRFVKIQVSNRDMYRDYIDGKKEIAEINAAFQTEYVAE